MKRVYLLLFIMLLGTGIFAQNNAIPANEKEAYLKVITQRADKIASVLNISDEAKLQKVSHIIRDQYNNLNDIYTERDTRIKEIKKTTEGDKTATEAAVKAENDKADAELAKLHKKYLAKLSAQLTEDQVDQVKNGMTYGVLPLTYKAYQEQILTLTEEQKKQIFTWLTEAREHAMDAESSDKKHAWFGKYKGRINNYLSAAGYDLKKEGQEWEKRRKSTAKTDK
ncbi:DUF3826 domain-containing protein [Pedobacter heparinus]|uniref:DUF3826 domain-containing protein n=1 Tax=Pedobacter heparinus (strain ATCC 13125 / DSM 2366 / CIP 104194 / JCM 7457 / NBRC 12017 / NCIMB 9290 / NRRL B-14731 / HIM 762-3) TaxID=485917 RepID=C6Y183_PEDHD|nr:DUF3826 domain-containing protein [Pedobacter heparinus]ACU05010.1 hypothetical protein Phep_2811 [Pedobacter heparinus DSM 2366]